MIEIAPDLMELTLAGEADRQGVSVSEIATKAIKEWIDPEPWPDINEPMDSVRQVELPTIGSLYRGITPTWIVQPRQCGASGSGGDDVCGDE